MCAKKSSIQFANSNKVCDNHLILKLKIINKNKFNQSNIIGLAKEIH